MRRSAATFPTLLLLVLTAGCQKPEQEEDMQEPATQTAAIEPDYYATDPAAQVGTDAGATMGNDYAAYSAPDQTGFADSSGGRVHVVGKGDTLYSLARQYYNDQRRWKDIYGANGHLLSSPDLIYVGQELVIP